MCHSKSAFVDIDECLEQSANECHAHANCINTQGSYNCKCKKGFLGRESNCTGIK